jgi:hypothetical protein
VAGVVDEHVLGLDVFVDETALVGMAKSRYHVNGEAQKTRKVSLKPVPLKNAVKRLTARVSENKDRPPFVTRERQRRGRPRGLKFRRERVFVLKASQTLGQWLFCGGSYYQDGRWVAVLSAAVKRELRAIANWFQHVLRSSCH